MLTYEQIKPYLTDSEPDARYLHQFYVKSKSMRDAILELFSDSYPSHMNITRPKELPASANYRKDTYVNPFRNLTRKVSEAYNFIPSAEDFDVVFPENSELSIKKGETLADYCNAQTYSPEGPLSDWFFKSVPHEYLIDANAVVFSCFPYDQIPQTETEMPRPRTMIVPCQNVYMFRDNFVVLKSDIANIYLEGGQEYEGRVLYFFDKDSYCIAVQLNRTTWSVIGLDTNTSTLNPPKHYLNRIPAVKIGKWLKQKNAKTETLFESRLEDIIPDLKQAQQVLSDRCVERNFHTSSQEWRRGKSKCKNPNCKDGKILKKNANGDIIGETECTKCKGTGINPSGSGMDIIWVDDSESGVLQGQVRTDGRASSVAPGGYIERNTKPLELFRIEYKDLEESLYRKLNLQYIFKSYFRAESGTAKREDREDSYRELNTQAEHFISILRLQYEAIDALRYGPQNKQGKQLPSILVPVRFNLENSELTRQELNDARDKKYDPILIETLEERLLSFWVGKNSTQYKRFTTQRNLDPFRGYDVDQKQIVAGLLYQFMKKSDQRDAAIREVLFSLFFDALLTKSIQKDSLFFEKKDQDKYTAMNLTFDEYFGELVDDVKSFNILQTNSNRLQPPVNIENTNQV